MSEKNRRMVYDKLIAQNRQSDIPQSLIEEFGSPKEKKKDGRTTDKKRSR